MKLESAGATDVGMRRAHNEDSLLIDDALGLYVVADGMGGHQGGETASRLAVETIQRVVREAHGQPEGPFRSDRALRDTPLVDLVRTAVEAASVEVHAAAARDPNLEGMGTTVVMLLAARDFVLVGHVGDSRAYVIRGEQVAQITDDHSLVNEQVKAGLLTEEEARRSRFKNVITRSVGVEQECLVDVAGVVPEAGDLFVICSDGLANLVDPQEIRAKALSRPLAELPRALVELANARGGDDNITVIAVRRVE